jgi:hypothetical protein
MGAAAAKDAAPEVFAAAATHRPIDAPVVVAVEDAAAPALADHGVKYPASKKKIQSICRSPRCYALAKSLLARKLP